jgi:hypothetical protein
LLQALSLFFARVFDKTRDVENAPISGKKQRGLPLGHTFQISPFFLENEHDIFKT